MAITLGEIAVRLVANSAEFISGFNAAGASTKKFRAELGEHIGAVGDVLERGLAQFGEFGEAIGSTLGRASAAAGTAIVSFGKLGGSMGTVVGIGAGVAAGLAVAEAGIIGLAIHSAEGAAKLGEMSEKAGISSQTLAGLSLAGKGVGVETESIVKAFGFFSSNLVKSAESANFSKTALGRLGFTLKDIKDSAGNIRPLGDIFLDVARKISSLPESEQGAFVKALFGRGGLEILPLILLGVGKIGEKMEFAKKLGLGDEETVRTAREFKETTDEISAAFESLGLRLAKDLLPTLNEIVIKISEWAQSGKLQGFIDDIATVVRLTLAAVGAFADLAKATGNLGFGGTAKFFKNTADGFSQGGVSGAWGAAKKHFTDIADGFVDAFTDVKDIATSGPGGWSGGASVFRPKGSTNIDLSPAKEDTTLDRIRDRIEALQREAGAFKAVAEAGSQGESLIAQATAKANKELATLVDLADKDKTGRSQKLVQESEATIRAAAANTFYSQTIAKINDDLAKQETKLGEEIKATLAYAAASVQGRSAIAAAAIDAKLAPEKAKVQELADAYAKMVEQNNLFIASKAKLAGAAGPVQGAQADPATLALFSNELVRANAELSKLTREQTDLAAANASKELGLETSAANRLHTAVEGLNAAYLKNEDAVRAARIELQVQQFAEAQAQKGVDVTTAAGIALLQQKRDALRVADKEAYEGALAQESAQFNLNAQYDNSIVRLQRIRELMQQNGVSTLGVEAQIFDEQNRLIHQWDEWAFKVGTLGQKFKGVMGELIIQGRNAGAAISQSFLTAIDGIETGLAKLLTGQKADFKAVFTNLAESVTKAQIQKGVGALAEKFGFHIPGLGAKADGSDGNPFYVILKNSAGLSPLAPGTTGNIPLFGAPGTTPGASSGGIGGFFGSILSAFTGFHALGGSIPAGGWGIAGEAGPEIVQGPANITSAAHTYNITHNHNYPSAESRDLFGRTQKQNQARQARNMKLAYGF